MTDTVVVVCTDRGNHGQMELDQLRRTADGVVSLRVRQGAAPWPAGSKMTLPTEGGEQHRLGNRAAATAPDTREDYDGRTRWRFHCRVCGRDVPWNEESAIKVVDACLAANRRVVDVSLMP